jgi:site-specific recombinase XerD
MRADSFDLSVLLESFRRALHSEDASKNTTSAYLSDLTHFVSWYAQTMILLANWSGEKCEILERNVKNIQLGGN